MRGASGSRAWMLAIALGGLAGCTLISAPGDFGAGAVDGSVDAKTKDSFVPPVDSSMPDGGRMRPVLNCNPLDNKGCLGDTCTADAPAGNDACESGNCADIRSLRLTTNAADESSGICASACASDWDCPTGFACWSPGTGARMCVSYMYLQQTNVGSLTTESCTAPTQCASLSCAYGRCVRSCARDTDCDSDTSERCGGFEDYNRNFPVTNDSRNGFSQLACVPSTDAVFAGSMGDRNKALGDSCTNSNECVSRLCIGDDGGTGASNRRCRAACRTSADCNATLGEACLNALLPGETAGGVNNDSDDYGQVCATVSGHASKYAPGQVCTAGSECREGRCFPDPRNTEVRWCTPACAVDSDCTVFGAGLRCVPVLVGGTEVLRAHWIMACGK